MSALSFEFGMDANGYIDGARSVSEQTKGMERSVNRMIERLTAQHAELSGASDELQRYQAAQNRATDVQMAALKSLHESIAAEKAVIAERKKQAEALAALESAESKRKAALDSLLTGLNDEHAAIGKTAKELKLLELQSMGASKEQLALAAAQLDDINAANKHGGALSGLVRQLGFLTAATMGYLSIGSISTAMDEWTTLDNRLKLVTNSSAELVSAKKAIIASALETGQSLDSVGSVYQSLARNQDALKISTQEMQRVMQTINKTLVIGGGTAEGNAAALMQLGQALSGGTFQAEEFNSLIDQTPGLMIALARGLGVPQGSLKRLVSEGKITAESFSQAMLKASSSVDVEFGKMDLTIAQSMQNFQTKITEFIGQSNEATSASQFLSKSIQFVANNLDVLATAALAFGGARLIPVLYALAAGMVDLSVKSVLAARSVTSAGAAMQFFGKAGMAASAALGPLGLAGIVAALVGTYLLFNKEGEETSKNLVSQATQVKELTEAYKGYNEVQKRLALDEVNKQLSEANYKMAELRMNPPSGIDYSSEPIRNELQKVQDGSQSLLQAFDKLNEAKLLGGKEKEFAKFAAEYDNARLNVERLNRNLQVLEGKEITKTIYLDVKGKNGADILSETGLKLEADIKKVTTELQGAAANFGKTSEQIKILEAQAKLEALAKEKGSAAAVAAAQADLEKAKAAVAAVDTMKLEDEERKKTAQIEAQNRQFVEQTITGLERQIQTLGMSAEQLTAFDLAAKGATQAEIAKTSAMQSVIDAYQRQQAVMADLEGLDKQIARLGKSEIEVKLMDLRDKGATQAQLDYARKQLEYLQQYKTANTTMKTSTDLMKSSTQLDNQSATSFASGVDRFGKSVDELLGKGKEEAKSAVPQVQYIGPRGSNATETLAASKPTGLANLGTVSLELMAGNQKFSELLKTDPEGAKVLLKFIEEVNKRQLSGIRKKKKN